MPTKSFQIMVTIRLKRPLSLVRQRKLSAQLSATSHTHRRYFEADSGRLNADSSTAEATKHAASVEGVTAMSTFVGKKSGALTEP
jgi:hypothetical protein